MRKADVMNCSFSQWYPHFRPYTIRSSILPIPPGFLEFLRSDGISMPSEDDMENDLDCEVPSKAYGFETFESEVKASIKELGGVVMPKLNWSAPKDATWISYDNSMRCTTPTDIYMLLKSSDFIEHDLSQPFSHCQEDQDHDVPSEILYALVLRRWHDLNPASEFRCFVRDRQLIALCQRTHTDYYPFISQDKNAILHDIHAFFTKRISGKFPDVSYTFDVYRRAEGKVWLLDFNPFGEVTDSLLFTWDELLDSSWPPTNCTEGSREAEISPPPIFRFVQSHEGIASSPYQKYAFPRDLIDLTSGEDPAKLLDLLNLHTQRQSSYDDDEAEDS